MTALQNAVASGRTVGDYVNLVEPSPFHTPSSDAPLPPRIRQALKKLKATLYPSLFADEHYLNTAIVAIFEACYDADFEDNLGSFSCEFEIPPSAGLRTIKVDQGKVYSSRWTNERLKQLRLLEGVSEKRQRVSKNEWPESRVGPFIVLLECESVW